MSHEYSSLPPDSADHFSLHIPVTSEHETALDHLARATSPDHATSSGHATSLSRQKLKLAMKNGAVWLQSSHGTHRVRRAKKILHPGESLYLYYDESIQNSKPREAKLIADEGDYSIWNKPCGTYSQGTKWGDHCTIYRCAEAQLQPQRPAFLVHRLDRAANGLIILAHSKKVAAAFAEQFQNRRIEKRYSAVVAGKPDISLPFTIEDDIDGKPALSRILALEALAGDQSRLVISIETGRKHQIRKHLAGLGHPIIGDRFYGATETRGDLQLQANYLKFACPTSGETREYSIG